MKKLLALILVASAFSALTATADIIPTLSNITPSGSGFLWNYSSTVTNDQRVETNNYFTIYDFSNISPSTIVAPAGWTFTAALVGKTPSLVNPTDNNAFYNVTFTYTGGATVTGPAPLGIFSIYSDTNQITNGFFAAEATRSTGPNVGTTIDNVGRLAVPVPEMSALAPLLGVCGLGAIGLVSSTLRRRQRNS